MSNKRRGLMLVISSPSGAGKSTLCKMLVAEFPEIVLSVSATTRDPRPGEQEGREYYFLSREEFEKRQRQGAFIESAHVHENRYGTPRDEVMGRVDAGRDVLFGPLGMSSTSYRFADYEGRRDRAVGHIRIDGGYQPEFVRDADQQAPAGGVSSSVNDMTHWLEMVLANGSYQGRQLIDPKALLPALSPQVVSSPPSEPAMRTGSYGFGFNVGVTSAARTQLSHSGAFELGAGANVLFLPSADVAIVALTNATPSGVPEALTAEFADLVQFGSVREDWYKLYTGAMLPMGDPVGSLVGAKRPANPAPAQPLSSYVGTYRNDYWGPAVIAEKNGRLALTLGPRGDTVELTHWDGNTFTFSFISENSPPGSISKATFEGGKLTLEYYDEAVFTK